MLKNKQNENIVEKANLTISSFRKEKNLNSFGNSSILATSETRSNDSFFNKYNNIMKNIFPTNDITVKNTFNSVNFVQSSSNLDLISGLIKKENIRDSSISKKLSELKFSMLIKQSNTEKNFKADEVKLLKSHSLKNKHLKELTAKAIPIHTINLNVNSTKNKLETLKVEMLQPYKTKSNNVTTPRKKNLKNNNLKDKFIMGEEIKEKTYLNSGTNQRAQNIKAIINKNLSK